jgi:hypothetical protein
MSLQQDDLIFQDESSSFMGGCMTVFLGNSPLKCRNQHKYEYLRFWYSSLPSREASITTNILIKIALN